MGEKESCSISIGVGAVVPDFLKSELQWESLESAIWVSGTMFLPPPKDGAFRALRCFMCMDAGFSMGFASYHLHFLDPPLGSRHKAIALPISSFLW